MLLLRRWRWLTSPAVAQLVCYRQLLRLMASSSSSSYHFAGSQNRTFSSSSSRGRGGQTPVKSTTTTSPSSSPPSPLLRELLQRIQWSGPLTVAEYMKTALTHPRHGFYTASPDVFGSRGHFTTSPEVSALFGEMVAVWVLYEWQRRTAKPGGMLVPLRVVELGPGRGFLTADVARVLAQFEAKQKRQQQQQSISSGPSLCSFHLVEISDRLRAVQERTVCGEKEASSKTRTAQGQPVSWHRSLEELFVAWDEAEDNKVEQQQQPPPFTVFLANEYFDAFPVHKFVRSSSSSSEEGAWREVLVDVTPAGDALRLIQARHPTPSSQYFTSLSSASAITGDHYEVCPGALLQTEAIAERLAGKSGQSGDNPGGAMLIIDYGFDAEAAGQSKPPNRDTFRAFRAHALADPLAEPGAADLTADVDFDAIRSELKKSKKKEGVHVFGTVTQEHFLRQLGIGLRLEMLLQMNSAKMDAEAREQLVSSVRMLLEQMGRRFRVMAVFAGGGGKDNSTPVGFEREEKKA